MRQTLPGVEQEPGCSGRKTVERVLAFSRRLIARYPKLAIGSAFALRVAEASLELDKNDDAIRFAQRALHSGVQINERAQALWTISVAEHRLKHFDSARKNLETLIRDYPKSDLSTALVVYWQWLQKTREILTPLSPSIWRSVTPLMSHILSTH